MRPLLRKLFSPLLNVLESGNQSFGYKPSHRIILLVMSSIFLGLAIAVFFVAQSAGLSYLLPVIVFGSLGVVGLLVGSLGNERAVAKIWGSR